MNQFVSAAHAHVSPISISSFYLFLTIVQDVKALLSVGSGGISIYWSSSVATPLNCSIFANFARFADVHDLDGYVLECV